LYRIVSECSTGAIQPYTGFIPPIIEGSLKRVTNTTRQWKIKMVDAFNIKGMGREAYHLKGTEGDAECEKYGGLCWDRIPIAALASGESWVNSGMSSLNAGKSVNACLEALTNDPFPLEIEIEYEYECLR
jgi:hypothetical protein